MSVIIITIQIQVASVVSDTNGFINVWLRSMARRRERHNSLKSMLTIQWRPHPNARRILWCLRYQFISAGPDPKNPTTRLDGRKLNCTFNGRISATVFSKSSNSQDHLLWAWRHQHTSPTSCLGVYYDKWWLSYSFCAVVGLHQMIMYLDYETLVVQTLTKLYDEISSSSSSCRATSTDIPDPLSPLLPIAHRPRQVFRITSRILT